MSDPFIGQIMMFGGTFAPNGWALCNGQLLPIAQHTALFSILGTTYGGDGQTTFKLPDLRGRVSMHWGTGAGLSPVGIGQTGGAANTTLTTSNLPPHTHPATVTNNLEVGVQTGTQNTDDPDGAVLSAGPNIYNENAADATMGTGSISGDLTVTNASVGNGASFSNHPPFQSVSYIIALSGIFPSQNFQGFGKGREK